MSRTIHVNPVTGEEKHELETATFADAVLEEFNKQHKSSLCCNSVATSPFSSILQEMQKLYEKKNHDYGNSFSETIQEFGFTPAIARINDKFKRVKQMVKGEQMQVSESMRDNLIDIANYCVLTIIEIDKQNK